MEEGKGGESEEGRGPREEFVKLLKKAVFNASKICLVEIEMRIVGGTKRNRSRGADTEC